MNRAVYKHLLQTFGRNPGMWIGWCGEIIRTLLLRIYVTIAMAQAIAAVAAHNYDAARRYTVYFFVAYVVGTIIGSLAELLLMKTENQEYSRLMTAFYKKLTNKDMAFYRDNRTGYLASVFRQYVDGMLLFARFLRGNVTRTVISLVVPVIILLWVDVGVGLVACALVFVQVAYVFWSSSISNKYRRSSNEVYRKVTAEIADQITNVVAFKSGGIEYQAHKSMRSLISEEIAAFWKRRRTATLLDLPRGLITAVAVSAAFFIVVDSAEQNSARYVGIIVLHDGAIIEQGTHQELLKAKGRYYSLWQKQTEK